jgi:hypothetical protein
MATSSTQPGPSDVPPHYLPIPAAQDESSWRTYINGRKGKGRVTQDEELTADAAPLEGVAAPSDVAAAPHIATDIKGEQVPDGTALEASSTAEGSSTATSKVARTEPRPPIPILMRALEHVGATNFSTTRCFQADFHNSHSTLSFHSSSIFKSG